MRSTDDAVAALRTLVGFPTESRTSNLALIEWFADRVDAAGGRATLIAGLDGRANLLASFGPEDTGGLLLSGHTDVVPAGTGWSSEPYAVTPDDAGRLRGRGTADMKGFLAAVVAALPTLPTVTRPLHIGLSYDEEIGCVGVRGLLAHLRTSEVVRPDLVLIGEPTMMRPCNRHLGKLAYELAVTAEAGHSSLTYRMPSAISAAAAIVGALDRVGAANVPPTGDEPELTVNCGTIRGGTGMNVIADRCDLAFEVRHSAARNPDVELATVFEEIGRQRSRLHPMGDVQTTEVIRYPGLDTDTRDPHVRQMEALADEGPCAAIGYGTEGGLYSEALDIPVVICGPGNIAVAHRADEYVDIDQLTRCGDLLERVIRHWCAYG